MSGSISRKLLAAGLGILALLGRAAVVGQEAMAAIAAPKGASAKTAKQAETPKNIVRKWPASPRGAAELLLEKYGEPDQFDRNTLVWFHNGDWKKTIVRRAVSRRDPTGRRKDFIEQTVGYLVPGDKIADLNRFNPMIEVSLSAGEMSFASESESNNRLALNLAEEILTGKRGVADARAFYAKTTRLAASGKSSSYLDQIQFEAENTRYMTPTGSDR